MFQTVCWSGDREDLFHQRVTWRNPSYNLWQQKGDVEELRYMARFINNPEEEYNMNMHALLPIVLIRLPPGTDLYFRKNTPAELNSKNKHGCFFWAITVVEFMFIRIKFGGQICLQDLLLPIVKDT